MWANCYDLTISNYKWWLQLTVQPVCAEILKLFCVALLDDFHFSLECELITLIHGRKIANGATNCPSMWTENNIHVDLTTFELES